jgi:hypothetical protein
MVKETPKILYKALRQYAHNTRVGDLFAGFDYDETVKIVESQAKEIEGLRECLSWILRLESNCSIKVVQRHIIRTHMDTQPDKGGE